MNARILNRDFTHPTDGWYQIEPKGEHANRQSAVIQVLDDEAIAGIVNRFNADAEAGRLSHGNEMLIDHEHFKHELDQESRAYGWLGRLQQRGDGIYGQIRWTTTGKAAVDGGDYRFFSTEYDPADLKVLNGEGKMKRVRPTRLDGLSLTNSPNNKGGKPITNRGSEISDLKFERGAGRDAGAPSGLRQDLSGSLAGKKENNSERKRMKSVATKLGLSAEASEEAVLAAVTTVMNRAADLEKQVTPLSDRVTELQSANQTLLGEQCDALMDAHGIRADAPVRNRLRPVLVTAKNREDRMAMLADFGFKVGEAGTSSAKATEVRQTKLMNRDTKPPQAGKAEAETDSAAEKARATKIMNRAAEIQRDNKGVSLATAVTMAQGEIENAS